MVIKDYDFVFIIGPIIFMMMLLLQNQVTSANPIEKSVSINKTIEGFCVKPESSPVKMDLAWAVQFGMNAKYIPMGSENYYLTKSIDLLGHPMHSWSQLNHMCLKVSSNPFTVSMISGFGKQNAFICEIEDIGKLKCCPIAENEDHVNKDCDNSDATKIVATWSDGKDYLLTINCQPDGYKTWNVVSTKNYIEPSIKQEIYEHIKLYGFDPKLAVEPSYDSCLNNI